MTKKPLYLFVTPFFPSVSDWRGGYCYDMVKAIMRDGRYDVHVFKPGDGSEYVFGGVTVHTFKELALPSAIFPFLFTRRNNRSFLAAVKRAGISLNDVAVCHCHTARLGVYAEAVKTTSPMCLTLLHHHDLQSFGLNNGILRHCWLYNLIEFPILRSLHERIDCHVFLSELSKRSFELAPDTSWTDYDEYARQMRGLPYRQVRIKNSIVYNNGVDLSVFHPQSAAGKKTTQLTIGCVGNFVALKDQLTLLKAIVRTGLKNIKVIFVGSGPTRKMCESFAAANKVDAEFRSEMPHEQLVDFYRSLDLFVLPSYFEGFGCVYTEVWACGVPFITTSKTGVAELIAKDDWKSWVMKPRDAEDLAKKILGFYQQPQKQKLVASVDIHDLTRRFLDQVDDLRGGL